jgi:Mrp family chromosome partitioning ATPase
VPKLLHHEHTPVSGTDHSLHPIKVGFRTGLLSVMSIGLLLEGKDDAVIWRGPMKHTVIKQFLRDVDWGRLDFLVVDAPPGTGDEPMAVAELARVGTRPAPAGGASGALEGAVVVTTPQALAVQDVRRCVTFCRQLDLPVLGVIENMSGFTCPGCGQHHELFGAGGGQAMAADLGLPFLGAIPIDPAVVPSGDQGTPIVRSHPDSPTAVAFRAIVDRLLAPARAAAAG